MLEFLKIFGLTILGIIAFFVIALLGIWILFFMWPIVILALPIAALIYLVTLIKAIKLKNKKKK